MSYQPIGSERGHPSAATRPAVDEQHVGPVRWVTASTDISAAPDVVWELYCDPHRYPEIAHATERMLHVPDGPMGVGYTYKEIGVMGPFKSEDEWQVTAFEPTRRQVHHADDGTVRSHLEIDIEPTRTGCRVTQRFGVEPRGAMRLATAVMWPLFLRRLAQRAMDITVANVKELAEASRA